MEPSKNMEYVEYVKNLSASVEQMKITMIYEGRIDQEIINIISEISERNVQKTGGTERAKSQVIHILIELLQNISKYSADSYLKDNHFIGKGVILVGKTPNSYLLVSGNKIKTGDISKLTEIENSIHKLDEIDLKKRYTTILTTGSYGGKSGAGLGFTDIARKSKNDFKFHFHTIDQLHSFFSICVTISSKN